MSDDDWDKSTTDEEDAKQAENAPKPQKKQESSDDDWDNDVTNGYAKPSISQSKWEGEDEFQEEEVRRIQPKKSGPLKPKQIKALKMSKIKQAEMRKDMEQRRKMAARQKAIDDEIDPMTRRLKAKKLAEEADHQITNDLFGDLDEAIKGPQPTDKQAEEDSIVLGIGSSMTGPILQVKTKVEEMSIVSRKDVDRFIDMVAKKMEKTTFTRGQKKYFIDKLLPKLCKNLTLEDVNSIKKGVNIICNKKAKDPNKKKKKGFGKKSINMRSGGAYQDYSMFDDFDSYM